MLRRIPSSLVVLPLLAAGALIVASCSSPERAPLPGAVKAAGPSLDVQPDTWLVELDGPPTSKGGDALELLEQKIQIRAAISAIGAPTIERYAYERLWNGLSLHADDAALAQIKQIPGVKAAFPVLKVPVDPDQGGNASADLFTALKMTGADVAQSMLGLTGKGILVGVIDSGIDYDHPDLGGCFGPGCRVVTGYDFVGDSYDANTQPQVTPDADPDDCGGHGTHVSGIIGANGKVKGVAPGVKFGAYRVFGCNGSTNTDIMMAAMERAEADGVRVVNMSIGSAFAWPEYPSAVAANQLVEDGVVVVASIGNSGTNGLYAAGAPGIGANVIGVASIDNTNIAQPSFAYTPNNTPAGYNPATGAPTPPTSGTLPLLRTGTIASTTDACSALPAGSLTGSAVLIRRGGCTFFIKSTNAMNAGASAIILYNNAAGQLSPTVVGNPAITVPVVAITAADGVAINAQMDQGAVTIDWNGPLVELPQATGGLLSSFTSFGLAADLSFKPDLAAPGGSIYSTFPLELGGYASLSGTSMSSPHVAGAAALLLEGRPEVSPKAVRWMLQNSAAPALWAANPASGVPDAVHRQGAGLVHIDTSILSSAIVTPSSLALGQSITGPSQVKLTVTNVTAADITYDLSAIAAISTDGNTFTPTGSATGAAGVSFGAPSVLVPGNGTAQIDVTITADAALANGSIYGGYVVLTPQGGGSLLRVPFAGFKGDYKAISILTPTAKGYPWLASISGNTTTNQPGGATYTLQNGNIPYVVAHFDHFARKVHIDVYQAGSNKYYGRVYDVDYYSHDSTATTADNFAWNGYVTFNKETNLVPNGQYVLKLSALKALGDEANPADWETWSSPVVTIDHP